MQLFTAIKSMKKGDIIAMYSAAMLPINLKKLEFIFSELRRHQGKMHFVLEAKTIKNLDELNLILFSYSLRNMFDKMHQTDITSLRKMV